MPVPTDAAGAGAAWGLAGDLPRDALAAMTHVVPLDKLPAWGERILEGNVRGRIVVDVNA